MVSHFFEQANTGLDLRAFFRLSAGLPTILSTGNVHNSISPWLDKGLVIFPVTRELPPSTF
jgi:hypothetical protein